MVVDMSMETHLWIYEDQDQGPVEMHVLSYAATKPYHGHPHWWTNARVMSMFTGE